MPDKLAPPEPENEEPKVEVPLVFLSYSHDSREHKQWVAELAQRLVKNGVQVLFDQWDLDPGDDVPKFMERAVSIAGRVLMVCTEEYVRKADDGKGGVGYEAMIVTGELVDNLGTKKFIPIVRQDGDDHARPKCVKSRLYINLCEGDQYEEEFENLLRELHEAPKLAKPTLGKSPFAGESFAGPAEIAKRAALEEGFGELLNDPEATYNHALEIIRDEDTLRWRRLLRAAEGHCATALKKWKENQERPPIFLEDNPDAFYEVVEDGVVTYAPFFACLLAAAESQANGFADQTGWIDSLLNPDGWETSGSVFWVDFPDVLLFVGQALVGGMLMEVGEGNLAYQIGTAKVGHKYRVQEKKPIFARVSITGWPDSITRHCTRAWKFLDRLIESWTWLHSAYGNAARCRAAITGYYLLLNFLNFVKLSKEGNFESGELEWSVSVPLMFCAWGESVCDEGYDLLLRDRALLRDVLSANGLEDEQRFKQHWEMWIKENGKWLASIFPLPRHDLGFPHRGLPDDLNQSEQSLQL